MKKSLTHMKSHGTLLGEDATEETEDFASIDKHASKDYPPTFIWCGDDDTDVPPDNTKLMAKALKEENVPVEVEIFPNVKHGVGLDNCKSLKKIQFSIVSINHHYLK